MPLSIGTPEYIFEAAVSTMLLEARRVIFFKRMRSPFRWNHIDDHGKYRIDECCSYGSPYVHLTPLCLTCLLSMHTTPHRKILEGLPQRLQLSSSKKEVSPKPSMKPRLPGILPEGCVAFLAV